MTNTELQNRVDELEEGIRTIYQTAEDADGTRGGMAASLDEVQDTCIELVPEIEDDSDGDGISDADETED